MRREACVSAIREKMLRTVRLRADPTSFVRILFTDKYRQRHVMDIDHRFYSGVPWTRNAIINKHIRNRNVTNHKKMVRISQSYILNYETVIQVDKQWLYSHTNIPKYCRVAVSNCICGSCHHFLGCTGFFYKQIQMILSI